jgi:predicted GNAT superfamily acetyltransferase
LDRRQEIGNSLDYSLRPCQTLAELAECIRIQQEIWGYAERELYPLRLFVNLPRVGGHVLGAFTKEQQLVGFVVAMPAWHGKRRYLHSLSLGVIARHQNRGLGRALKLAQRDLALSSGINCIEWTFDPLRARNANLNINHLGAIVRRYEPNLYGGVESQLQQGLPSDRLIAEWWLKSPRVERALAGQKPRDTCKEPAAQVEIPTAVEVVAKSNLEEARKWQTRVREQLQECFERKLAVTGFTIGPDSAHYLLDPYEN